MTLLFLLYNYVNMREINTILYPKRLCIYCKNTNYIYYWAHTLSLIYACIKFSNEKFIPNII